jgi:L-fuconolactonase
MIDAHQHCWRLGENGCLWPTSHEAPIHRNIMPEDWAAVARPFGVTGSVLVQSQESVRDTAWLLELAAAHDFILGVVGWVDLKAEPKQLTIPEDPWLKGLRPMVQGRTSGWLDDPALDRGIAMMAERGLVFDALIRAKHLPSIRRMAKRHPTLQIVIDHGAKPEIDRGWLGEWKGQMLDIARQPNVTCKLSGLLTEAKRGQTAQVAEVAEWLFGVFGAERLIWGSDWPVLELASDYGTWFAMARTAVPAEAHGAVFEGNARRVYKL